jgi:hypothetical protein
MLFVSTDPATGTREIRAFNLWIAFDSVKTRPVATRKMGEAELNRTGVIVCAPTQHPFRAAFGAIDGNDAKESGKGKVEKGTFYF